jgi:hypothetical protein
MSVSPFLGLKTQEEGKRGGRGEGGEEGVHSKAKKVNILTS